MEKRSGATVVPAILAAVAGTGYASGRELVLFFAQTGRTGWIGICLASVVFGLLVSLLCRCGGSAGATDFVRFCQRMRITAGLKVTTISKPSARCLRREPS